MGRLDPKYQAGVCELIRLDGSGIHITTTTSGQTRLLFDNFQSLGFVEIRFDYARNASIFGGC